MLDNNNVSPLPIFRKRSFSQINVTTSRRSTRHHAQAEGAIEDFKNVWPTPFASDFAIWPGQSATTYPVSGP